MTDQPWLSEPDRVDPTTNLPCLIRRGPAGAWCGYVGVPVGHPWHGKYYLDIEAKVHGGLTYAEECDGDPIDGICHLTEGEDNRWWLGFDCSHSGDLFAGLLVSGLDWPGRVYRDQAYVTGQTTRLAAQIAEVSHVCP